MFYAESEVVMVRVVVGKTVRFVPERMGKVLMTLLGATNKICDPHKVQIRVSCAGKSVQAEVTQSLEAEDLER